MKVGVLGSGVVGQALGAGFVKHGHDTMLGTRDPQKSDVREWVRDTAGARAGTFGQAAQFGELIVLAVLGRIAELRSRVVYGRLDGDRSQAASFC